jgi:tRNA A-37 threonylcarbamoyl transferase component Bud32
MLGDLLRKFATFTHSPGLPVVRLAGRVWHLAPGGAELFGPGGPDVERWVASGSAAVVKANPARTVYRVELAGGTVFVKHCRVTSPRAWGREIIRMPKARLEFDNARALRERGVPAVEPLAWGASDSHWPGESFLITRALAGVPFLHFLERDLAAMPASAGRAARRHLAHALAQLIARLHDAGVAHPDPHPGNLLVELPESGIPRFALLDLHDVRVGRPLTWPESRDNLALFNRWFQMRTARPERARFWQAYRTSRVSLRPPTDGELRDGAKELERQTHASNLRLWAGREGRWLGSNRTIRRVRRGSVRGLAVRDLPDDFLQSLLADPDAVFAALRANPERQRRGELFSPSPRWGEGSERSERVRGELSGSLSFAPPPPPPGPPPPPQRGEGHKPAVAHAPGSPVPRLLKDCPSATVAVIAMPTATGPVPVVFKRVNVRSWLDPLKNLVRRSQALRSWLNGHALRDRWLPTPRPLAVFHRYRGGLPAEGYVLTEMVPDAAPLRPAGRELSDRLARTLRAMHDRGVSHRDLKAPNILLANGTDPVLIDLVGVRTQVQLTVEKRAKELARLNASFVNDPALTQSDRLRFLLAYLASGPALGVDWKNWWELVSRATAAKVARNRRAGRVLG